MLLFQKSDQVCTVQYVHSKIDLFFFRPNHEVVIIVNLVKFVIAFITQYCRRSFLIAPLLHHTFVEIAIEGHLMRKHVIIMINVVHLFYICDTLLHICRSMFPWGWFICITLLTCVSNFKICIWFLIYKHYTSCNQLLIRCHKWKNVTMST